MRVLLGSDSSGRLDRFKGTYSDVLNGGKVKLTYGTAGTVQTVEMAYDGLNWTADIEISVGIYDFSASAFNRNGVMIFSAAASKTHDITSDTTELALGIQLNPIMEETSGTPMPVITQITKPAGYLPGGELNLDFTVMGSPSDALKFRVDVKDNESNQIAHTERNSSQIIGATNNTDGTLKNLR